MKKFLLITLFSLTAFCACAEDASKIVKLTELKLFPDTEKGHYGTPLKGYEFSSAQKRQLTILQFDKSGAGQKVKVRIVGEKTTFGAEKTVKVFEPVAIDKEGRVPVELSMPKGFPPGKYRAEVIQGDKVVGSAGYLVKAIEPKKTAITAAAIDILRIRNDGTSEKVTVLKASDHNLVFVAETKGARTAGAHVVWTATAVETTAGKKELPGLDVKDWPLDDTALVYEIELPRDWPLGKYKVELKVDDELIKSLDYEIKE